MGKFIRNISIFSLILAVLFLGTGIIASAQDFQLTYTLSLSREDYPDVEIKVTDAPVSPMRFTFGLQGGALGAIWDLTAVFKNIQAQTTEGEPLSCDWDESDRSIVVKNDSHTDFLIKYSVDALNLGAGDMKFVLFRQRRIFFIAGDVFPLPYEYEPTKISVKFSLPEGVEMFSSLPEENGEFVVNTDLWDNLLYDFQKACFTGGKALFSLTHYTQWGDKYIYIWFDRDPATEAWLPSYDNTPWEQAEEYMKTTEMFAKYYKDVAMGPLPQHTVVFANTIPETQGSPSVKTSTDWFHYMQIWPKYSEPEVCHHLFHQYSFFISQSKLPFSDSSNVERFLAEGLPTYFEQIVPTLLLHNDRYQGKLFEFFVLDERGKNFGIRDNSYHITYNISAVKVYLLDQHIREKTGGAKNLTDFTKEMWNRVKDNKEPQEVPESQVIEAYTKVAGDNYISEIALKNEFSSNEREKILELLPYFESYTSWMTSKYFWGNKLLFLVFLDIVSAKGEEWPHFATAPHNILRYRRDALVSFKNYLENLHKGSLTESDIVNAMNNVTGGSHTGFFEFWKSLGISLNPNSVLPLSGWNPEEYDESQLICRLWDVIGTLKTEHYLSGVLQKTEAILDNPDDDGTVVIDVRLQSFSGYPPESEAKSAISGGNVSFLSLYKDKDRNLYLTGAYFKVTTNDKEHKRFSFNLKLPSFSSHPQFWVYNYPIQSGVGPIGVLYWLHTIDPIDFEVKVKNNLITLPDTSLDGETFLLNYDDQQIQAAPNEVVTIPVQPCSSKIVSILLFDKSNFLRGYKEVKVSLPPIAYPNPCYPNKGQQVTMANLPLSSKVYIYTISGELVRTLDDATEIRIEGGSATATWNLKNDAGEKVARGIYIYLIPGAGEYKTGKIAIIK